MYVLQDISSLAHRVYHTTHNFDTNGQPCGIPVGFYGITARILIELRERFMEPANKIACMDWGRCSWRTELYPAYKQKRDRPEIHDFLPQMQTLESSLPSFGFRVCKSFGVEADDLIAVLANELETKTNEQIVIITSDKDLWQLLTPRVQVYDLQTNKLIDTASATEILEFPPDRIVEYKSLAGDTSDNIPGAKGIGKIGAKKIITEQQDLRGYIEKLKNNDGPFEIWGVHPESSCQWIEKAFATKKEAEEFLTAPDTNLPTDGLVHYEVRKQSTENKKIIASYDDIKLAGKLCTLPQYVDQLWSSETKNIINETVTEVLKGPLAPDSASIFSLSEQWKVREPNWEYAFQ